MSALGFGRLASVLCLATVPACATNTVTVSEKQRAEPVQLRPPAFNSSSFDLLRSRIEQNRPSDNSVLPPGDIARMAERCANTDNMPGAGNVDRASKPTTFLFLLVGRGSGGALPMPNGCDPKVDSIRPKIGRN